MCSKFSYNEQRGMFSGSSTLPPISKTTDFSRSKSSEQSTVTIIRSEMIKIQQTIQRLTEQYEITAQYLPDRLPELIFSLKNLSKNLAAIVNKEKNYDFANEMKSIEKMVQDLTERFNTHLEETKSKEKKKENDLKIPLLAQRTHSENNQIISKLQDDIEQQLELIQIKQSGNQDKSQELKLTTSFTSGDLESPRQEPKVVLIPSTVKLDPELHRRVQQHSLRIRRIEDQFDDLFYSKRNKKAKINAGMYKAHLERARNDKKTLDLVIQQYHDLRNTTVSSTARKSDPNSNSQSVPDSNLNEDLITQGDFKQFKEGMISEYKDIAASLEEFQSVMDNSISEFENHCASLEERVTGYEQSAANFEALIQLLNKNALAVEDRSAEKPNAPASSIPVNEIENLTQIMDNGKLEIQSITNGTMKELDALREKISKLRSPVPGSV